MEELELINLLLQGPDRHNKALTYIYDAKEFKQPILTFLKSKGMGDDDSKMLWTDIVVKFGLLVKNGKYQSQGKMVGYLKNLANYMLLNHFRDRRGSLTEELNTSAIEMPYLDDVTAQHSELKLIFETILSSLGGSCKSILTLWAQGYSMEEIMVKNVFVSLEATRKRKHICLKKLLDIVDSNKAFNDLLQDYKFT